MLLVGIGGVLVWHGHGTGLCDLIMVEFGWSANIKLVNTVLLARILVVVKFWYELSALTALYILHRITGLLINFLKQQNMMHIWLKIY